jgi:allantoate deiminase
MVGASVRELVRRLELLGRVSDDAERLTRTFLSPAMRRANSQVGDWMREAGLVVREDAVGNLVGRLAAANPKAPTLVVGSHLDTVRDAGRFDGPLGVLLGIAAVEVLRRSRIELAYSLEVVGFSEEEGVRFGSAYLGSKGYTGTLRARDLALRDRDGVSIRQALEEFGGGRFSVPKPAHRRRDLLGYLEVHLEQGPVLEAVGLPVGVVTAIAGQTRLRFTWTGKAGHAGTTPMALRRDALAGAAEFVLVAEALARRTPGLMATVGSLETRPGAPNVIPGTVQHTLDVRHEKDRVRNKALADLLRTAQRIADSRRLSVISESTQANDATPCAPLLSRRLAASVAARGISPLRLPSGAGHDGVVMAALTPIAMLFVRCRDGLSHHPDEFVAPRDLAVALEVTVDFLERMGR